MLSLDCIEQCVEHIGECDILWHDYTCIYEDNIAPQNTSLLENLGLKQNDVKAPLKALDLWKHTDSFSCVCMGVFHISLFEKLRFTPTIQSEDALFGMLVFAKAKSIEFLNKPLYIYRMRANSTSDHTLSQATPLRPTPAYLSDIAYTFYNSYKIKHYHFAYSCAYICLGLLEFISILHTCQNESPAYKGALKTKLIAFLQLRAMYAFGGVSFESDPKNIRALLKPLEPYMQKCSFSIKLAYYMPRLYRILRYLKQRCKAFLPISKT
ncbi:glycosyl transferase [Helicobacter marmotae]|uniref:Glycosyl transferase n=4 Tax=Helicobacter marmotae TaxID=152490 RepID=A0A3D8I7T5_9HELI|nr:glycosyl transferase [Helicobacter marmotae]